MHSYGEIIPYILILNCYRESAAESILLSFIAVFLSVMLIQLLLPALNNLAGKELATGYLNNWSNIGGLFGLMLFVGVMAGSYPAFFLSSCKPVNVLKGIFSIKENSRSPLRRSPVVCQFTVSIILIISTIIVHNQLDYIQDKKLGFEKEHVAVIEKESALGGKHEAFKQELSKHPGVISAGRSTAVPGISWGSATFLPDGAASNETHRLWLGYADHDFAVSLNLEMAEGQYFSHEFPTDSSAVIINEAAVRSFGWQEPIDKRLASGDGSRSYKVIGVVEDFNFQSLHQQITPIAMLLPTKSYYCLWTVRMSPENIKETLTFVQNTWESFSNGQPMKYYFLDDDLNMKYKSEQKMGQIFSALTIVAIFLACLGLFGLVSFTAEQRTKEIGIRKAFGASVSNIVQLLSKEFTRWVIVANIIAWPIAYFVMNNWLLNFAYRIEIEYWVFVLASGIALVIALITVTSQAVKTALANPVDVLRYE